MGSMCSCLRPEGFAEYVHPDDLICRHCACFGCFTWRLVPSYSALFQRGEVHAAPSSVQEASSLASTALVSESSFSDTYCSPPRPLSYDDPRCFPLQHDVLVSRREKSSNPFQEESEPLGGNNDTDIESKNSGQKWSGSNLEGESKLCCPISSAKHPAGEITSGARYVFSSFEDEDVCPTCLEEYTFENPRIVTQCAHHFHLGCIYEWMERSESCPVCGKVMVFNETL